jgi:hypothetical protein
VQLIDDEGRFSRLVDYPAGGQELESFLSDGSPLAHPAVMLRKMAVESVGLYRPAFKHAEDYDLWLRVHDAGYAIENLKTPLLKYRQHAAKVSVVHRRQQALATLAAQCAHRARQAELPDPTVGLDRLDELVFDLFPRELMAGFGDRLFAVHMAAASFETRQNLVQALSEFQRLPADLQRTRAGVSFLTRAGLGALQLRLVALGLATIARAFMMAPAEVGLGTIARTSRLLRGLFSGHGRDGAASRRVSAE